MESAWEEELARKFNRLHGGGGGAPPRDPGRDGKSRDYPEIDKASLLPPFMRNLESAFSASIKKFNRNAKEKASSTGLRKGKAGQEFEIRLGQGGFLFEDSGDGYIRIWRIREERQEEFAFVGPHPAETNFAGWVEKEAYGFKTDPTRVDEGALARKYLGLLVENP